MIKEVIVVEGKDDFAAVKAAVEAEIITTSGFGINDEIYRRIEAAYEKKGIIIFTDPDYAGESIRRKLSKRFPNAKHAYLPREEGTKKGNVGVENADPESILKALKNAMATIGQERKSFTMADLYMNRLAGDKQAAKNREIVGNDLGIGYGNAKTFLNRLNNFGITKEAYSEAITRLMIEEEQ